ncbi:hypothetical protein SRHO_G00132660 [Serrasalmus rhombeus]
MGDVEECQYVIGFLFSPASSVTWSVRAKKRPELGRPELYPVLSIHTLRSAVCSVCICSLSSLQACLSRFSVLNLKVLTASFSTIAEICQAFCWDD